MKEESSNLMGRNARGIALQIVYQVLEKGAFTNLALEKNLRNTNLKAEDIHFVTELVNGTIRMLKHLDWVLALFLKQKIEKLNPWLKNILRISAYQILFMDKVPAHAIVNEAVNLTRTKTSVNLSRVCNGVLRNLLRGIESLKYPSPQNMLEYLAVYYSQPEWLVNKLISIYGESTAQSIMLYYNKRPVVSLRNNILKGNRDDLIRELNNAGITAYKDERVPCGVRISSSHSWGKSLQNSSAFKSGKFYVQNSASMLAAYILKPVPGDCILDLCCGVGGKSTHIAEIMMNKGKIFACDIFGHKLTLLKDNSQRLGINIINTIKMDILTIDKKFKPGSFNKIVLDAPCSGLGVLNRRSDLRWMQTPQKIKEIITLQEQMLNKAADLLELGGTMVYSTCTINPEENEEVIQQFLDKNRDFALEGFLENMEFFNLSEDDKIKAKEGLLTILPGKYDTDGMFYAKIRRKN